MKFMNSDDLTKVSDVELKKLILNLRSRIKEIESEEVSDDSRNLNDLQSYYCYVYRELEHRGIV